MRTASLRHKRRKRRAQARKNVMFAASLIFILVGYIIAWCVISYLVDSI